MNEMIQVFESEQFGSMRVVMVDDEPYFVGKDVAITLGYANPGEAIQDHVDTQDKLNSKTLMNCNLDLGQRGGWLINESGLCSLVLSSKLPTAKKFKRWVFDKINSIDILGNKTMRDNTMSNSTQLQIFENTEFGKMRTLVINGEPWFVGRDVAISLGYSKPENAIKVHVNDEDKTTTLIQGSGSNYKTHAVLINESGLYSLVLSSKLDSAKRFKHWVTSDVLPSIRKHGLYAIDEVLNNPDVLIAALTQLKEERAKSKALTETIAVQRQQITELQPKANYYDMVLRCKDLVAISVIAKDYGWSARRMNQYLHNKGVQYKQGRKTWLLYQKYAEMGYTHTKTHDYNDEHGSQHVSVNTYWTQAGRLFIYDLLKADGILPTIERAA